MARIIEIHTLDLPELIPYTRLTEAQLRSRQTPENGLFVAESAKVIEHALDAGCEPVSLLMSRRQMEGSARAVVERCPDLPVYTADEDLLETLTGYRMTRGVLCAMRRPILPDASVLCENARRVAVLDGIGDPANVGAIFRNAAALGADAVLVASNCCDPLYRRAVRVSMGTVFQVPWTRVDAKDWPRLLHDLGFKTAALALTENSLNVDDPILAAQPRLALALGSEGDGLSPAVIGSCDFTVRIPMCHGVDSLNVAAASAVALWQLRVR